MLNEIRNSCPAITKLLLADGTLTVGCNGPMPDFPRSSKTVFAPLRDTVKKLVILPGTTTVGDYAFSRFEHLESIELPEGLRVIGCSAFGYCPALSRISVPEGVGIIGPKAFYNCNILEEISLPATLRAIDFKAFQNDNALKTVFYNATKEHWERCVRISRSSMGNDPLFAATYHFQKTTPRFMNMTAKLKSLLGVGDASFHIIAPNLTVPDITSKSGDCTLLIFPEGKTMLIDAGHKDCREPLMTFLRALPLKRLDYLVLSHPHSDHFGNLHAAAKLIIEENGGSIGEYWYAIYTKRPSEDKIIQHLKDNGVTVRDDIHAGDCFEIDGVKLEILGPASNHFDAFDTKDDSILNDLSLVMHFTYGSSTYLTAGDLHASREEELVGTYGAALQADVAKTNHHASYTSNTPLWCNTLQPHILISHNDDNRWTLFEDRLAKEGIRHYMVCDSGLLHVSMDDACHYHTETEYPYNHG